MLTFLLSSPVLKDIANSFESFKASRNGCKGRSASIVLSISSLGGPRSHPSPRWYQQKARKIVSVADTYISRSMEARFNKSDLGPETTSTNGHDRIGSMHVGEFCFRARLAGTGPSPRQALMQIYEDRRKVLNGVRSDYEEKLLLRYPSAVKSYLRANSEALGTTNTSAVPETVAEAAMMKYVQMRQRTVQDPDHSFFTRKPSSDEEEGQRPAFFAQLYKNLRKPTGRLFLERRNQIRCGLLRCHGCNYEEKICVSFPGVACCYGCWQ